MQTTITVEAQKRPSSGKGPARRLRAASKLPAIVYGPGKSAQAIAINPKDVKTVLSQPMGRNTVFTLSIDGATQLAMVKNFEYHPVSRDLLHADLYTVTLDRAVEVEVPLVLTGKSKGVALGGILQQIFRKLPVRCTPDKIPAKLEVDITNVELHQSVPVKALVLADGVRVMLDANQTIVSVVAPEKDRGEAAPAAGAAAAAPAAAGKDAKAAAPAKDAKAAAPAGKKK
ncbi:MAG: 50S ribosomal protein L25 [Polyangiales bacterium]